MLTEEKLLLCYVQTLPTGPENQKAYKNCAVHLNQVALKRERQNLSMRKRQGIPEIWFGVLKYICFHWSHRTVTAIVFCNIFKTFRLRIDIIMHVGHC